MDKPLTNIDNMAATEVVALEAEATRLLEEASTYRQTAQALEGQAETRMAQAEAWKALLATYTSASELPDLHVPVEQTAEAKPLLQNDGARGTCFVSADWERDQVDAVLRSRSGREWKTSSITAGVINILIKDQNRTPTKLEARRLHDRIRKTHLPKLEAAHKVHRLTRDKKTLFRHNPRVQH